MLEIRQTTKFKKDLKKVKKRNWDGRKLTEIVKILAKQEPIPEKYLNHPLKNNWGGFWELHIYP